MAELSMEATHWLVQCGMITQEEIPEDRERRHLEMMAAQTVAALIQTGFPLTGAIKQGTEAARAIQAEVAATEQGVSDA